MKSFQKTCQKIFFYFTTAAVRKIDSYKFQFRINKITLYLKNAIQRYFRTGTY
ncbi:hypothetical protein FLCU109888_02560 [Flavobacterium cucumis]|uniref:Uncharacterized protein n=1 Tax=Flavobacterium cucumis TaxID=416016 RepID=A0A1M7ZUC0_9FLAO|nr:hypothetical protein SAMN05443547_0809 [Flavobacterium cucumis]